jgi:hypothetical protein
MEIQLIEMRLLPGQKITRAFCDIGVDGITIRDFRVYQANGRPSVRNPFNTYKDHEGNLTFREIVSLPPTVQTEVHALILSEYFRQLKENKDEKHR